jgi:hypothetical protein
MDNFDILDDTYTMTVIDMIRYTLADCWRADNKTIGIVVPEQVWLAEIFHEILDEEKTVPNWMKSTITRRGQSNGCIVFDNGSMIKLLHGPNRLQGIKLDLMFVHSKVNIDKEWMYAFRPIVSSGHLIKFFQ